MVKYMITRDYMDEDLFFYESKNGNQFGVALKKVISGWCITEFDTAIGVSGVNRKCFKTKKIAEDYIKKIKHAFRDNAIEDEIY